METDKFQLIQKLIDNQLSQKKSQKLIEEIKNNEDMKLEFALLMKIKQESRNQLKQNLLTRMRSETKTGTTIGVAASALGNIRSAAFSANTTAPAEDLPIDESTIEDFLNSEEGKENKKD